MIKDTTDLVILAAGHGARFPNGEPKCLKMCDGERIISRLVRCIPNFTPLIVCRSDWDKPKEYDAIFEDYGSLLHVENTQTQGQTMSWVLSYLGHGRDIVFVSADTFPLFIRPIQLPAVPNTALFDPLAWVTILRLTSTQATENMMANAMNKMDYITRNMVPTILAYHPWANINTPEDIAATEVMLHKMRRED